MILRICDVEHGACALLSHRENGVLGRLAMIDSGHAQDWRPSTHIRYVLRRTQLDYLFITNADLDHMSDLNSLWEMGIHVASLTRNPHPTPAILRAIKLQSGSLGPDIERFLSIHETYNSPIPEPFDTHMGRITFTSFFNSYPAFQDTNNLSLVIFFEYQGFKILFPGDLEAAGWLALLTRDDFRAALQGVDVLVASHHGRENGYSEELFKYCQPRAIIMSDKAIQHETQKMAGTYRARVVENFPDGVLVRTTMKRRHVLTTRRDGHIEITVSANGDFTIDTEYLG
ncbi:ComEC/Rec2 family competence protein [Polaromonas sp. A23]|uniref:ComEC/Rec2 family competence protein n=1 Tax=Polaromonas sp. A23 TaxID=1944133 RepID=UPI0020C45085|nr:MBL fold metallo-hydrolase [Polaromonas sp. A23]